MNRHLFATAGMVLSLIAVGPVAQATAAKSTFNSGTDGWRIVDLGYPFGNPPEVFGVYSPVHHAGGGNPGGFISMTDPSGNWFWFDAPSQFLGDQSGALGHFITFDMLVSPLSPPDPASAVMLVGSDLTLHHVMMAPTDVWNTFSVALTPSEWRVNDPTAGVQPTDAQMLSVLGDLIALRISGDWLDGTETAGLDNVFLTMPPSVPAPGAILLGTLGTGLVGYLRRRRTI